MTTVLLPRPIGSDADADLFEQAGIVVLADPYIETTVRLDEASLAARSQMAARLPAAALVVTSVRALGALIEHGPVPRGCTVYAVGPASAAAARAAGFSDIRMPADGANNDALVRRIAMDMPTEVVIPRSSAAPSSLITDLRDLGIVVHAAILYDTVAVAKEPTSVAALRSNSIDAVVVRSGSAARALAAFVPEWPTSTRIVAGGGPTATVLHELGLPVDAVAAHPDAATVVATTLTLLGIGGSHD